MEGGLTRNDRAECPVDCHLEGSRPVSSSLYFFATTWLVGLDVLHSLDLQAAQLSVCRPHGKMHVGRGPCNKSSEGLVGFPLEATTTSEI